MLKGICPKCGKEYHGWALQTKEHQYCECGALLLVFDEQFEKTEEGRQQREFFLRQARQQAEQT